MTGIILAFMELYPFKMPRKNTNQVSWKGKVTGIIREDEIAYVQVLCRPEFIVLTGVQMDTFNLYDDVVVEGSVMVRKIRQDMMEGGSEKNRK